jgi:hypothetical protein
MPRTGADVKRLLEEQWRGGAMTPLYVSGLRADFDAHRVTRVTTAGGRPLDKERRYSVVANELIADGERFPALHAGTDRERIGTDLQALVRWLSRPAGARAIASTAATRRSRAQARSRRFR